ncbi:MAG: phage tail tape measure protein [Adlercreutzia equolifaciens]
MDGLGQAFKNCAANCNAAGMDVETTSAAIAMMANQGLKGSEAGTALNAVMERHDLPHGGRRHQDRRRDRRGHGRPGQLPRLRRHILADVEAATDGMGDAEKAAALQSTFTADSIEGLNLHAQRRVGRAVVLPRRPVRVRRGSRGRREAMTDNLQGRFGRHGLGVRGAGAEDLRRRAGAP